MSEVNPNGVFFKADGHELVVENCTVEATPPQWTKEPPSAPGHYWVWQPAHEHPCYGQEMIAEVRFTAIAEMQARAHGMEYWECVRLVPIKSFWQSSLWLGPIPAPAPPTKEMQA